MKICTGCKKEKSFSEFHKGKSPDGLRARCKECTHNENNSRPRKKYKRKFIWFRQTRELLNQHKVKNVLTIEEQRKNSMLKKRYGISLKEYNVLFVKQKGVCAICGRGPGKRSLHVDHDHKTGKVRALLCSYCNTTLGNAEKNIGFMDRLIGYLKHYQD